MKKLLMFGLFLFSAVLVKADPLCTNWGALNVCLPLSSLNGAYGFNFNAINGESGNQALVETMIGKIKDKVSFTFGGAKTSGQEASPYLSVTYGIANPIVNDQNPLSWIRPGVYGGKDFSRHAWIYGIKASVNIF